MSTTTKEGRHRRFRILGVCISVQVFVAAVVANADHRPSNSSPLMNNFQFLRRLRSKLELDPVIGQRNALSVKNVPQVLPRRVGAKDLEPSPIVYVDSSYVYNPSIVELADGTHIFAARMSWLYGGNCQQYANLEDPETMYNCLKTHVHKFADQSVLGAYHPESYTLEITTPSTDRNTNVILGHNSNDYNDVTSWNGGPGWFDTRLVYPYDHRHDPLDGNAPKIFMTSQTTEILGYMDWVELGGSTLVLQLTYIRKLEPQAILHPLSAMSSEKTKMTRWLFYDAQQEQDEWERRRQGKDWTPMTSDVARLRCQARPSSLPGLPFTPGMSEWHRHSRLTLHDDSPKIGVVGTDSFHRRVPGMNYMDWHTIKDKNWAPFVYRQNDENRVLWSYSLEPHVVCENDVDLTKEHSEDVDCVLCIAQHNSSSPQVFDEFYSRLYAQGYDKAVAHLNGAPAYYIAEKDVYLGLMHTITTENRVDAIGRKERRRTYHHFFYQMQAQPPFRIAAIARRRIPLVRSRCWFPWFEVDDVVEGEFAMNMQYHPDRPGKEIAISYGDGDRYARADTFTMNDVWQSFENDDGSITSIT